MPKGAGDGSAPPIRELASESVVPLAIITSSRLSIAVCSGILRLDGLLRQVGQARWQLEIQLRTSKAKAARQQFPLAHRHDMVLGNDKGLKEHAAFKSDPHSQLSSIAPSALVYKDFSCGCCTGWVEHLKSAGFLVTVKDVVDTTPERKRPINKLRRLL